MDTVALLTYDAKYAPDFARLNYQWIEQFFAVEDEDRHALEDPEGYVIDRGGEIFFLLEGQRAVGTVAMVPYGEAVSENPHPVYELAKMAVDPTCQGKGYGQRLMQATVSNYCINQSKMCGFSSTG